ncbi:GCN5-related N-acetyltransferase [Rhodobacterales bacterium HTCC2150]|nr:GCN5-related N-acetyltransferase [Rhodobacterales bacterium HTCC2150] [Rhodobacteraceae bacterium HTCC2150]
MVELRYYQEGDDVALHHIYYRAVHEGTKQHYNENERRAWAPRDTPNPDWEPRLSDQITLVAIDDAGTRLGFMTLGYDGHLDFAYVLPDVMGKGVATMLHDGIVYVARALNMHKLDTEASHLARRFFLRQGWLEVRENRTDRYGVTLTNFWMHLKLTD